MKDNYEPRRKFTSTFDIHHSLFIIQTKRWTQAILGVQPFYGLERIA